jgi:hypothetical protein
MDKPIHDLIHTEMKECIKQVEIWNQKSVCSFGITGSALNSELARIKDIDCILVIPDHTPNKCASDVPKGISLLGWPEYQELYSRNAIEMFVSHFDYDSHIKLEIYPISIAMKMLSLQEFRVRRLGQGPLRDKPTILKGSNGSYLSRPARIQKVKHLYCAENDNCIKDFDSLYIGVHLERLLLTHFIFDNFNIKIARNATWKKLRALFSNIPQDCLPYGGEVENIFTGIQNHTQKKRQEIRKILLGKTVNERENN